MKNTIYSSSDLAHLERTNDLMFKLDSLTNQTEREEQIKLAGQELAQAGILPKNATINEIIAKYHQYLFWRIHQIITKEA